MFDAVNEMLTRTRVASVVHDGDGWLGEGFASP